ncbi:MAG: hypothetical protein ABII93_01220 [Chrysiogenia bacterium]
MASSEQLKIMADKLGINSLQMTTVATTACKRWIKLLVFALGHKL